MTGVGLIALQIGVMFAILFLSLGLHFSWVQDSLDEIIANQQIMIEMLNRTGTI